ncbi:MAG: AhpC/TSA family protein [Cyclobacteriaceae bacterium]|nr:AhpC/TSA family protein [Cyclobacteriaceae bacterium]
MKNGIFSFVVYAFSKLFPSFFLLVIIIGFALQSCGSGSEVKNEEHETENALAPPVISSLSDLGIDESAGVPTGLQIGDKAPGFAARDIQGMPFDLYSVLLDGPVVLVFYRGKWCTYCNQYLSNLGDSAKYIQEKGATLVVVTPELKANALEMAEKTKTNLHVISDPGNNIMDVFKVTFSVTDQYVEEIEKKHGVNISTNNGNPVARLPVPATYIIGNQGDISYVHFDLNYGKRAPVSEIIRFLP